MSSSEPFVRDDVRAFLDLLAQVGRKPMRDMALEEARAGYMALHTMGDRPARELAVIRDLACPGPAGEIALRLYDAREAREPGPLIVYFHGGGFVIGDLDTHHNLCTEIAHQLDLPVIAVDYRRAPEHRFPAALDDCIAASRWIGSGPDELGREATGLIPMGDSAGGNAAIVVSRTFAAEPADIPVLLQVPIFPLGSYAFDTASIEQFAEGYVLTKENVEFFEANYQPDISDWRVVPTLGTHDDTPPTVLVTASLDPIRDSGRDYGAALALAGVDHISLEMKGVTHSFTNLRQAIPSAQADLERVFAAIKLMLADATG